MIGRLTLARTEGLTKILAAAGLATLFAALVAISAQAAIPIGPVPITLQVLFVALTGLLLGSRLGLLSLAGYYVAGVAGLPVFASGNSGIAYATGPTGGYLIGFVAMAFVVGLIIDLRSNPGRLTAFIAALAGVVVLYLFGAPWLGVWFVAAQGKEASEAVGLAYAGGIEPFILIDLLKVLVAALVFQGGRELVSALRR